jgi:hypothetical protein
MTTLDTTLTLKELIDWRLHWLCCDLEHATSHPPHSNVLEKQASLIKHSRGARKRLMWEINTIYGHPTNLIDDIRALPNWSRFDEAVNKLCADVHKMHLKEADRFVCGELGIEPDQQL